MGFFGSSGDINKAEQGIVRNISMLHRQGCKMCPLDTANIYSPKMEPTGSNKPLVYMLGEAPGKTEDELGEQFVGASGDLLRPLVPREFRELVRWSNVINCRPPGNRDPERIEEECCRPRLVADIEATKPRAIFGFGNVPLAWATNKTGIANWRGRKIPIKVGKHVCWYYPFYHPSALLRNRRGRNNDIISEDERATQFDLARAFSEVRNLEPPVVHSESQARAETEFLDGSSRKDFERLASFLELASASPYAGVDYETNGRRPYSQTARLLSAAVSLPKETVSFGFDHPNCRWTAEQHNDIYKLWRRFLSSPCKKISHGLHFELEWSAKIFGPETIQNELWEDTMTQAHVLDERVGKKVCFGLGFLTTQYFGVDIKEWSHLDRKNMINEPLDEILPYNAIDAKYHRLLWEQQTSRLNDAGLDHVYRNMLRRVPTAILTQLKGFPVDLDINRDFADKYQVDMDWALDELKTLPEYELYRKKFRKEFNPGAPADVKKMIHDILKVETDGDTTDKATLQKIDHAIIPLIIDYREANKLKSTYCDSIRENTYPDGLVHQELQTIFVVTSRASSDSPNMKNLPKRTDEAKQVRKQFVAPNDYSLLAVDYAQIQVRNVAMESKDPVLCKYIWEAHDMHSDWSKRIAQRCPQTIAGAHTGDTEEKKLKWLRQQAKSGWTFCLLFGGQLYTAIQYLQNVCKCTIEEHELQPLYDEFWETFVGVHEWHSECRKLYREQGYIENLTGVRRRAPIAANQLINAPIQADEAAMVWDAFQRLSALGDMDLQPINEIYDDLTFLIPDARLEECIEKITLETTKPTFSWEVVPIGVELSIGKSLYDLTPIGEFDSVELHGLPLRPNYSY